MKLLVKEAVRVGVKHIIITHPLLDIVDMTPAEIKEVPNQRVRATRVLETLRP